MRLTIIVLLVVAVSSAANSQELVSPPTPTGLSQAADEASSLAAPTVSAGVPGMTSVGAASDVGFKPGGFFHALSTTRHNVCQKLKHSALGGLIAEMRKPLSTITGGMVAPTAAPSAHEIAAAGPQGTAAQIQAIKIDAPKRVAAIQQLKGIDIRYHPEAGQALIAALRADPSDCVRLEAARTIASLRTCTKPIAEALRICVEGTETDGNPAELSPAVKQQAASALSCCLNCLSDSPGAPATETRPEFPSGSPVAPASFTAAAPAFISQATFATLTPSSGNYYTRIANVPRIQIAGAANRALQNHANLLNDNGAGPVSAADPRQPQTPKGLFEIWQASRR